jgi:hypothetical protein
MVFAMLKPVPAQPRTLLQLIGARMRALRDARGLLQEDVAAQARSLGFDWTRGTVAMLEAGRRRLTLEEWLLLPQVFDRADAAPLTLPECLPDAGVARLTPYAAVEVDVLRAVCRGQTMDAAWAAAAAADPVTLASRGEAERKAAQALHLSAHAVARAAQRRWGRSLTEERDHRFAEKWTQLYEPPVPALTDVAPGFVQALKGHITRQLLAELRQRKKRRGR